MHQGGIPLWPFFSLICPFSLSENAALDGDGRLSLSGIGYRFTGYFLPLLIELASTVLDFEALLARSYSFFMRAVKPWFHALTWIFIR